MFLSDEKTDRFHSIQVIDQVNPHLTLVSNRADESLVEGIKKKRKWSLSSTKCNPPSSTLHLTLFFKVSQAAGGFTPTVEIRPNREFQASQGRSYLLDLPVITGEEELVEDGMNSRNRHGSEDELVAVGQGGLRGAQDFMRLRKRRVAPRQGQLGRFVNSLRLGGSVTLDSEKSVSIRHASRASFLCKS